MNRTVLDFAGRCCASVYEGGSSYRFTEFVTAEIVFSFRPTGNGQIDLCCSVTGEAGGGYLFARFGSFFHIF